LNRYGNHQRTLQKLNNDSLHFGDFDEISIYDIFFHPHISLSSPHPLHEARNQQPSGRAVASDQPGADNAAGRRIVAAHLWYLPMTSTTLARRFVVLAAVLAAGAVGRGAIAAETLKIAGCVFSVSCRSSGDPSKHNCDTEK